MKEFGIERYDFDEWDKPFESRTGVYVKAEDFDALTKINENLKREINKLKWIVDEKEITSSNKYVN